MKNFKLVCLMAMTGFFLFLGGCQKDETSEWKDYNLELRNDRDNNSSENQENLWIVRPSNIEDFPNLQFLPSESWDFKLLLKHMSVCERAVSLKNNKNYGTPIWGATITEKSNGVIYNYTPTITEEDFIRKYVLLTKDSSGFQEYLFIKYSVWDSIGAENQNNIPDTISNSDVDFWAKGKIKCPTWKIKNKFNLFDWFAGLLGDTPGSGGWENDVDWGSFGNSNNDPGSGNYGGGGGGSSSSATYFNPKGGFGNSDSRLLTAEGCKKFWQMAMGSNAADNLQDLQNKINTCGCYNAVLLSNSKWERTNDDPQLKCLACYTGNSGSALMNEAFDALTNIEFSCGGPSNEEIQRVRNDALRDVCNSAYYQTDVYPERILQEYLGYLNSNNFKYYYKTGVYFFSKIKSSENFNFQAYEAVNDWMATHNNDAISTQVGNQARVSLCSGTGGNDNTVNVNFLEAKYIHETLKVNYSDYNISNVNIDEFISIYGVEKYFALSNFYVQNQPITWVNAEYEFTKLLDLSGQDFFYDDEYWQNPNLTFPSQDLPSYLAFYNAFPKWPNGKWMYGADNLYPLVGGAVAQARIDYPDETENTCALKVSIALNGAGINIPKIAGQTIKGSDNKYYFLNASSLTEWMKKTFGESNNNTSHMKFINSEITGDIQTMLNGKKGIFSVIFAGELASGNVDIYTGTGCASRHDCNVNNNSTEINLWILND